jgi:competence CoiA-like predicted nuclease
MYKCFDKSEQKDVIILDAEDDEEAISALRQKSRAGDLLCPECRQAVQARAGNVNAWHFAHLDLGACPLQSESGAVSQ